MYSRIPALHAVINDFRRYFQIHRQTPRQINIPTMEVDMQLSQLLSSMNLEGRWCKADIESEEHPQASTSTVVDTHDAYMSDSSDSEDSTYLPSQSPSSSYTASADAPRPCGCPLLQAIHEQVRLGQFPTTSGEYLDAIFTHREVFSAYPPAHRMCAISFSDIAQDLERRGPRPDRDGDPQAVAAFRHEANWIAAVV